MKSLSPRPPRRGGAPPHPLHMWWLPPPHPRTASTPSDSRGKCEQKQSRDHPMLLGNILVSRVPTHNTHAKNNLLARRLFLFGPIVVGNITRDGLPQNLHQRRDISIARRDPVQRPIPAALDRVLPGRQIFPGPGGGGGPGEITAAISCIRKKQSPCERKQRRHRDISASHGTFGASLHLIPRRSSVRQVWDDKICVQRGVMNITDIFCPESGHRLRGWGTPP